MAPSHFALRLLAILVAGLLAPLAAHAANHQICFQGLDATHATITCRTDDPSSGCTIDPPSGWNEVLGLFGPGWRLGYYDTGVVVAPARARARVTFHDGTVRSCTTELAPIPRLIGALAGYTTDASGLVTTGVFSFVDNVSSVFVGQAKGYSFAPAGFLAAGGGVVGAESPIGTLLQSSYPYELPGSSPVGLWIADTFEPLGLQLTRPVVYAIALAIEGLSGGELNALVEQEAWEVGAHGNVSSASSVIRLGRVLISGGAVGRMGSNDQWNNPNLTATYPVQLPCLFSFCSNGRRPAVGWTAATKGFESRTGQAVSMAVTMPERIVVGGASYRVRTNVTSASSGLAQHPAAVVAGRPGEYALTAIGARVDWTAYGTGGNYLWKLLPRPDIAGAEVASKDHAYSSPAVVTAFAVGMKLERE